MEFTSFQKLPQDRIDTHLFLMESKGYDVFSGFYTEEICIHFLKQLEKAIDEFVPHEKSERSILDKYHMHDLLNRDLLFSKKLEDPRLQQILASVLGDYWIMYAYTSSSLPPNGKNYGSRIHVYSPRWIPNYPTNLGVIWALDDFTLDNGATYVLPGSHNTPRIPTEDIFNENCIRLSCKRGDLIVFNARLWHRAGENHTEKFRHALTMNVCRPYMKQRMDWVRFIPESITNQLNSQARRILGFDTRLPSNLEEFFQPEELRFYKGNQE
jgi:ectoine hydroxylase-related dioxygenase (phytanoyl-CoA dioxygenase family)